MTEAEQIKSKKQLAWQCRRGMLELDVVLIPFLERYYDDLEEADKIRFCRLLDEADPDLYTWLMGYGDCADGELARIVSIIKTVMKVGR